MKQNILQFNFKFKSSEFFVTEKNMFAYNFIKKISSIRNNQKTIRALGPSASIIAECEGLDAHAKSIQARLNGK